MSKQRGKLPLPWDTVDFPAHPPHEITNWSMCALRTCDVCIRAAVESRGSRIMTWRRSWISRCGDVHDVKCRLATWPDQYPSPGRPAGPVLSVPTSAIMLLTKSCGALVPTSFRICYKSTSVWREALGDAGGHPETNMINERLRETTYPAANRPAVRYMRVVPGTTNCCQSVTCLIGDIHLNGRY
jgi:hypothetical protein